MRAQDGRAVTISNTLDLRLKIFVRNNGDFGLERVTVSRSVEPETFQVLGFGVLAQNLTENPLLHGVRVLGGLLYELKHLRVLLGCRWA